MSKTVCIYHANCFDGICAAWVVWKKFGDKVIFQPMSYSDPISILDFIGREDTVYMVDFSLKTRDLQELATRVGFLNIIDHHKTAEAELRDFRMSNIDIRFNMNESGASLTWKTLMKDEVPRLVQYIADRDLWLFKEPYSEEVNAYIQSFPMEIQEYEMLYKELELSEGFNQAVFSGESILRYKNQMVEMQAKSYFIQNIGGYDVPVVNATMLFSEVGNALCKKFPEYPFAAYYADKPNKMRQWGLRSIGDFDVSEIAKDYGGGGHKNAAGFMEQL